MKKLKAISFWLLLTLGMSAMVFTSCSKDDEDAPTINPIAVTAIALDKTTLALTVGTSSTLTATVSPRSE